MKKLIALFLGISMVVAFGCQQKAAETPAPATDTAAQQATAPAAVDTASIQAELLKEQNAYAQAWNNKDINFISENWSHDPDITIWGPAARDRVQGWDAVKAWYQASFDAAAKIDFKMHDIMIKISQNGTAAVITYYVENDVTDKAGKTTKMTPRVTVVKVLQDGKWKQIHGDASFSIEEIKGKKK